MRDGTQSNPNAPDNAYRAALTSSLVLVGAVRVYGFTVYSTKASAQYLNVFDADTLPADGAVPIVSWPLAANNGVGFYYGSPGRVFHRGITLCNSSTDSSKTIGSADCLFDVQFDRLIAYGG